MSNNNIITTLNNKKLLTENESLLLKTHVNHSKQFCESLLEIYENKVQLIITSCHRSVKKKIISQYSEKDLGAAIFQEITKFVYAAFLEVDKISLLPTLGIVLNKKSKELLTSIGMLMLPKKDLRIIESEKIFVKYVARYRLFVDLEKEDLKKLCEDVQSSAPQLFPAYLFNAFLQESLLLILFQQKISNEASDKRNDLMARILFNIFSSAQEAIAESIRNIIFYLSSILDYSDLSLSYRDNYFQHLKTKELTIAFANAVATGFVQGMESENTYQQVLTDNKLILDSEIAAICMPALSLIGMTVNVNLQDITNSIDAYNREIERLQKLKTTIDEEINKSKDLAKQKINDWRANVPMPEFKIGFQIGVPSQHGIPYAGIPL